MTTPTYVSLDNLTDKVCETFAKTPDARLRFITQSLARHLHAFIKEIEPTESEFEKAVDFLIGLGKDTSEIKNEVILASDILGASALIMLINDSKQSAKEQSVKGLDATRTDSALLGPFWRAESPNLPLGGQIARGVESIDPATSLWVSGVVKDSMGKPIAGAVVDVWQASPVGLYENQDEAQPDMNLRGQFTTDAEGRYYFKSVRPAGYPVPVDGPCGELLRAQNRHPFRPAHLHFMVSKVGYKVLITQVFADDDERLLTDVTFSVTEGLLGHFGKNPEFGQKPDACAYQVTYDLVLQQGEMHLPKPPIP